MTTSTTAPTPWSGFGYKQVPGLANRLIARYLRAQRKNMRRFFTERGLLEFADRMDRIRKSRQGMLAKNRMFQKVLDDYANFANPAPMAVSGETAPTAAEAEAVLPERDLVLPESVGSAPAPTGDGSDAGGGVSALVGTDGDEPVIEE